MSHNAISRVFRGTVAGVIGGAVASWVMNHSVAAAKANAPADIQTHRPTSRGKRRKQPAEGSEEPTVKVAQAVSRKLFDHELSETEKQIAGPAVHYSYGMLLGGLYGALAELWPNSKIGFGMGYGIAVWALGDEAALPALRLSPPPTHIPAQKHADTLAAHVCYGLTLDLVRRIAKVII